MVSPMIVLGPMIPLAYTAISIAVFACALNAQRYRSIYMAPLLLSQYSALVTSNYWPHNGMDSLSALSVWIWTSHSLSVLFFEESSFLDNNYPHLMNGPWYWKASVTWNNLRLLGTAREEKCTPRSFYGCSSRSIFATVRVAKIAMIYLVSHFALPLVMPGAFIPFQPGDFDGVRQTYFRRMFSSVHPITTRETELRAVFAIFWAWAAYAMLDTAHSALSILFVVILRVDLPQQWPPIFGNLRDTSSLRGFWGRFWHRLLVLPYTNYSKYVTEKILGLRPGSLFHRLIVAFVIFLISGLMHAVAAYQIGDRCGWQWDVWWFCTNFMACAVEGVVWSKVLEPSTMACVCSSSRWTVPLRKLFGFVWVFAFFFWSVPKWQYPKAHCQLADLDSLEVMM